MTMPRTQLAIDGGPAVRAGRLPLHKPWFDAREEAAMAGVLASTHVAGDGANGRELERLLRESTGALGVLALNSCTAALEIAVEVAGLGPGDEVILPSFTFVSAANAIVKAGARPVFADIDPLTLGLDAAADVAAGDARTRRFCRCTTPAWPATWRRSKRSPAARGLIIIEDARRTASTRRAAGARSARSARSAHCRSRNQGSRVRRGGALLVRDDQAYLRGGNPPRKRHRPHGVPARRRDKYLGRVGGSYVCRSCSRR